MSYSIEVNKEAVAKMKKRRDDAEDDLVRRREELFRAAPRAAEIERELAKISVAAGKAVFSGSDIKQELMKLKEKSRSLQNELAAIIREQGFPEDQLEIRYHCSKCRDSGYVDGLLCDCMKLLLRKTAYDQLNRISPLSLCSFDSFSVDYFSDTETVNGSRSIRSYMSGVLKFCRDYADSFSAASESLLFRGGTGLGKTHLSLAIARNVIEKGFGVIYFSAPELLSRFETNQFSGNAADNQNEQKLLTECDLLIVDDLGTEFVTKYTLSAIYNIINIRINYSKPTIVSTNLSVRELENIYGERMVSRIVGAVKRVDFYGTDIRQLKTRPKK